MTYPPRTLVWASLALFALLGLTVALAYVRLKSLNTPIALTIALLKILIVAAVFMELGKQRSLTVAFAAAGLFWFAILLWLAFADYATRPGFPPVEFSGGPASGKHSREALREN